MNTYQNRKLVNVMAAFLNSKRLIEAARPKKDCIFVRHNYLYLVYEDSQGSAIMVNAKRAFQKLVKRGIASFEDMQLALKK